MNNIIIKIKNSKIVNTGIIKKIKDKIFYSIISPREEKKTNKYRREILQLFSETLKGYKWQLLCGAFLRYYRDNTMDGQDLDFFVLDKDFEKVKEKLIESGFLIKQVFYNESLKPVEYKYLYKNVEIDVFIVFELNKKYAHSFTLEKENAKLIKRDILDNQLIIKGKDYITYTRVIDEFRNIKEYDYMGIKFNGPKHPKQMMKDIYGESWKVYDPKYNPRTCPINNMPILANNAKSIVYIKPVDKY